MTFQRLGEGLGDKGGDKGILKRPKVSDKGRPLEKLLGDKGESCDMEI